MECESRKNHIRIISANSQRSHDHRSDSSTSNNFVVVREMPKRKYDGSRGNSQKLRVPIKKLYFGKGGQLRKNDSNDTHSKISSNMNYNLDLHDIQSPLLFSQRVHRFNRSSNWTEERLSS